MKPSQRLIEIAQSELRELQPNLILKDDQGYQAFGRYRIVPEKGLYRVDAGDTTQGRFHSTKTALSWCIADNQNNLNLARRILELDERLQHTQNGLSQRRAVKEHTHNPVLKELAIVKSQHRAARQSWTLAELEKCIKLAKYLHHKGFSNETQRTGRAAPIKVYR
jgi:hypothetical protein